MNFAGALHRVVRRHRDREAVVHGERRFTFGELWHGICRAAELYRRHGLAAGERVLIILPNSPELLFAHFAALKLGAVSVPVKSEYRSWEVAQILANCRPRLLVSHGPWLAESALLLAPELAGVEILDLSAVELPSDAGEEAAVPLPSRAPASIQYTYFGDGYPKGAVLSHGNHLYAATGYARHQGFRVGDRFLIVLPMAHVYALSGCVNSGLLTGGALVILDRSTPKALFAAVAEHGITVLSAVPALYELLARFPHKDRYDLSSLRLCVTGGDFLPAALQGELEAELGMPIVQGYGLSECLPVICNPPGAGNRPGTLGIPGRRDIYVRILGPGGEVLPAGEVGEIAVRSPTTMSGYHRLPADSRRVLKGGWLLTGDAGSLDEDGYLHFHGMVKPIVNLHGNKADPLEVAAALRAHPAVAAAEVGAEPAPEGGRQMVARVVPVAGRSLTPRELREFLRSRLAAYKVPATIVVAAAGAAAGEGRRASAATAAGGAGLSLGGAL